MPFDAEHSYLFADDCHLAAIEISAWNTRRSS